MLVIFYILSFKLIGLDLFLNFSPVSDYLVKDQEALFFYSSCFILTQFYLKSFPEENTA